MSENCIGGVMVGMLASSAINRRFEPNQVKLRLALLLPLSAACFVEKQQIPIL